MPKVARRTRLLLATGGACSALVLGLGGAAQAAAQAAYPNLGVGTAATFMPAAKSLPVHMRALEQVFVSGAAPALLCPESNSVDVLRGGHQVYRLYVAKNPSPTSAEPSGWLIAATVFQDPATARRAMTTVIKAERACPKSLADDGSGGAYRSLSTLSSVGAWHGYRTIDHLTGGDTAAGDPAVKRLMSVFLTRGNVLLNIQEAAPEVAGGGPRQDAWRRAVTTLVLARFSAAS